MASPALSISGLRTPPIYSQQQQLGAASATSRVVAGLRNSLSQPHHPSNVETLAAEDCDDGEEDVSGGGSQGDEDDGDSPFHKQQQLDGATEAAGGEGVGQQSLQQQGAPGPEEEVPLTDTVSDGIAALETRKVTLLEKARSYTIARCCMLAITESTSGFPQM